MRQGCCTEGAWGHWAQGDVKTQRPATAASCHHPREDGTKGGEGRPLRALIPKDKVPGETDAEAQGPGKKKTPHSSGLAPPTAQPWPEARGGGSQRGPRDGVGGRGHRAGLRMDVVGGQGAWGVEDGQARGQAASSVLRWVILIRGLQEGPALLLWAPAVRRNNFLHRILFAFSRNPKRLSAEGVGDLNRLPSSRPGRQTWEGTFPQFQRPLQPPRGVCGSLGSIPTPSSTTSSTGCTEQGRNRKGASELRAPGSMPKGTTSSASLQESRVPGLLSPRSHLLYPLHCRRAMWPDCSLCFI